MSAHDAQHTDRENARVLPSVADRTNALKHVSSVSAQVIANIDPRGQQHVSGSGGKSVDGGRRKGNPTAI